MTPTRIESHRVPANLSRDLQNDGWPHWAILVRLIDNMSAYGSVFLLTLVFWHLALGRCVNLRVLSLFLGIEEKAIPTVAVKSMLIWPLNILASLWEWPSRGADLLTETFPCTTVTVIMCIVLLPQVGVDVKISSNALPAFRSLWKHSYLVYRQVARLCTHTSPCWPTQSGLLTDCLWSSLSQACFRAPPWRRAIIESRCQYKLSSPRLDTENLVSLHTSAAHYVQAYRLPPFTPLSRLATSWQEIRRTTQWRKKENCLQDAWRHRVCYGNVASTVPFADFVDELCAWRPEGTPHMKDEQHFFLLSLSLRVLVHVCFVLVVPLL